MALLQWERDLLAQGIFTQMEWMVILGALVYRDGTIQDMTGRAILSVLPHLNLSLRDMQGFIINILSRNIIDEKVDFDSDLQWLYGVERLLNRDLIAVVTGSPLDNLANEIANYPYIFHPVAEEGIQAFYVAMDMRRFPKDKPDIQGFLKGGKARLEQTLLEYDSKQHVFDYKKLVVDALTKINSMITS